MTTRQKLIMEKVTELGDLLKMEYEESSKSKESQPTRISGVLQIALFEDAKKQLTVTSITGGENDDFNAVIANMNPQLKSTLLKRLVIDNLTQ